MYIVASRTWDSQVVVTYGYLCTICFVNAVARVLSFSCHYLKKSVGANDLTTKEREKRLSKKVSATKCETHTSNTQTEC